MSLNKEQKQFLNAIEKHNEEGKVVDDAFIENTLGFIKCSNFTTEDLLQKLCEENYLLVYTYVDEVIYLRKDPLLIEVVIHLYFKKKIKLAQEELNLNLDEKQKQRLKLKESITHSIIQELTQKYLQSYVLSHEQAQTFIKNNQLDTTRFEESIKESTLKFFETFNLKDLTEFIDIKKNNPRSDINLSFYQLNYLIKSLELFERLIIIKASTENIFYFSFDGFNEEDLINLKNRIKKNKEIKTQKELSKYNDSFYFEIFHKELSQYLLGKRKKINFSKENTSSSNKKDFDSNDKLRKPKVDKDLPAEKESDSVDSSFQDEIKEVEINFAELNYEQLIEKLREFVVTEEIISTIMEYQNQLDHCKESNDKEMNYYMLFSTFASLILISNTNNQKIYQIIKVLQDKIKIENIELKKMAELKIEENYDKYLNYLARENFIKENQ